MGGLFCVWRSVTHGATLRTTPGARLTRWVFGRRWHDVLLVDGIATRLPRDTIHRLEMALAVREAGGSCR